MDVKQAAEQLGISSEGVRQRIRRGTLQSEKDTDGRVYVYLEDEGLDEGVSEQDKDGVLTRLESEVEFLRAELATRDAEIQRRDAILLSLSEGLRAIGPGDERGGPETASERDTGATAPEETTGAPARSWWRRFFGLE